LVRWGQRGTAAEQLANLREALPGLAPVLQEPQLVVTHGNGPQVGNELRRHELAADEVPPLPLWMAVAQTQAEIGALIESELRTIADRPVACVLTHVCVDQDDPAFAAPTEPTGCGASPTSTRSTAISAARPSRRSASSRPTRPRLCCPSCRKARCGRSWRRASRSCATRAARLSSRRRPPSRTRSRDARGRG